MVNIKVVVTGKIRVKNEFFDSMRRVEQNIQTQREVIEEIIRPAVNKCGGDERAK